ncbi:MAG: hypothetical protein ACYDBR_14390 [Gaiellaceae bacterium]
MADPTTVSELLATVSERKLAKMRGGVVEQIERLGLELRLIDDALSKKRPQRVREDDGSVAIQRVAKRNGARVAGGQFEGLSRLDLLGYVSEMKRPVRPPEVRDFLVTKGIVRTSEAIRVALLRLHKSGMLDRLQDGTFVVPETNGNGARVEAGHPLFRETDLGTPGVATPDE